MNNPKKPGSLEDLAARLRQAREQQRENEPAERPTQRSSGMNAAWQLAVEMVTALAVCSVVGWFLDGWLGTRPWFLVVFFLLGAASGMLNAYRVAQKIGRDAEATEVAERRNAGTGKAGEDEAGKGQRRDDN